MSQMDKDDDKPGSPPEDGQENEKSVTDGTPKSNVASSAASDTDNGGANDEGNGEDEGESNGENKSKEENGHKSKLEEGGHKSKLDEAGGSKSKVKSKTEDKQAVRVGSSSMEKAGSSTSANRKVSRTQTKSRTKVVSEISQAKFGFVGAGRMAESIAKGLLKGEKINPKQLFVAAKTSKNLDTFKMKGVNVSTRSYDIFGRFDCDIIFLCMHGYVVRNCFKLGGTRPIPFTTNYIPTRKRPIFILSLVGGVPLNDVKTTLLNPESMNKYLVEMHRIVLNTSVAYGIGLGCLDVELDSKKCHPLIRDTLQSLGRIEFLEADLMDSACTLIGNGMAIIYYFLSALSDGGFKMGLNKNMSIKLATKVLQSASMTILESAKNLADLRDACVSPSGAAIYGIHVLEKQDTASGIQTAIEGAYRRLKELVDSEPSQIKLTA